MKKETQKEELRKARGGEHGASGELTTARGIAEAAVEEFKSTGNTQVLLDMAAQIIALPKGNRPGGPIGPGEPL